MPMLENVAQASRVRLDIGVLCCGPGWTVHHCSSVPGVLLLLTVTALANDCSAIYQTL